MRPELTITIRLCNGQIAESALLPGTEHFFQAIAAAAGVKQSQILHESPASLLDDAQHISGKDSEPATPEDKSVFETIEYPLVLGQEFFNLLQDDLQKLEALQIEELKSMSKEIAALGKEVAHVAKPSRFSKSDLATWRDVFEIYLDAEVFLATREISHGARSSSSALKQLQWFQKEIEKKGLPTKFKLKESQQAYERFLKLNSSLLKNLQFQELNKTAVYKILKSESLQLLKQACQARG